MINSPKILRPFVLAKLIFAVSLLSNSSINGQVQTRLRDSGKEIASVEQIVIPGGQADLRTRVVVFQNANCWLDNIDPDLENFVSVEEVHIVESKKRGRCTLRENQNVPLLVPQY